MDYQERDEGDMIEALIPILSHACIVLSLPSALIFLILFVRELHGTRCNGVLFALRMQTGVMLFFSLSSFCISILGTVAGYSSLTRMLAYLRTIVLMVIQAWVAIIYSSIKE